MQGSKKIKMSSNRSFGILFFIVFVIIGLWPLLNDADIRIWSILLSLVFLILGIFNSKILTPFNRIWVRFGIILGTIIAPFVMGLVFFIVITPIGIIMRLLGKDLLNIKYSNKISYWIKRDKNIGPMKKQF
tara:strand:- start:615 stop:1007 length:393 start_codon:yes stop_codon:yes gene_type:complete